MKRLDELIKWYEDNASNKYEKMICEELKVINNMFDELEDYDEQLFIDKIIRTFCEVVDNHRDKIDDLEGRIDYFGSCNNQQNFVPVYAPKMQGFENDEQVRKAFTYYLTHEVQKALSSYTINDYCSRIKILWKTFYEAYKNQELPDNLRVIEEKMSFGNPLLNAYRHAEEIHYYIHFQIEQDKENRNWTNARAAFNKFQEFVLYSMK